MKKNKAILSPLPFPVDSEEWLVAPTKAPGSKEPIEVTFRVGIENISKISTVESNALINIAITMYWTDHRLVGWKGDLPPLLWGPILVLTNKFGGRDMLVFDEVFSLVSEEGRIKRGVVYQGLIMNPMDLTTFPFDCDTMDLNLHSSSHWKCLDGSRANMVTMGQTYTLAKVSNPKEGACTADPFARLENDTSGQIAEWDLHGYSCSLVGEKQVTGIQSYDI